MPHFFCKECDFKTDGIPNPEDKSRECPRCKAILTKTGKSCDKCGLDTLGIPDEADDNPNLAARGRTCPICKGPVQPFIGDS